MKMNPKDDEEVHFPPYFFIEEELFSPFCSYQTWEWFSNLQFIKQTRF